MYWIDSGNDVIQRADLNGTNIETLVTGLNDPDDCVAIGVALRTVYQQINMHGDLLESRCC